MQQESCDRKGACLLYDNDAFRLRLHLLPLVGKFVSIWLYCLALFFSVRRDRLHGVTSLRPIEMTVTVVDGPTATTRHTPPAAAATHSEQRDVERKIETF